MNSRLLLLFLLIAGFMVIWSDDQKQTDHYLASLKQENVSPEFVLNCFPENNLILMHLETLDYWACEIANFNPSQMQSLDVTIKECFPSALQTASNCPVEEEIAVYDSEIQIEDNSELTPKPLSYLKTASKDLNWMRMQSDAVNLSEEQLLLKAETPLMDRIADDINKSIEESFMQIQIMAEDYKQALEKIEKSSRIASEPNSKTQVQ